ncbi:MAG: tripartite tricarboxylate transporter permease [Candidatus Aenigmarchaeota archaeon]|nr:tripartite tricarboxylate transporter permease [Candidatus Aenigmarchaeota archaeon]
MFIDVMIFMLLGILFGTLTGLIPGLHPNTIFMMMVSSVGVLALGVPGDLLLVFIVSVAVSNTFTDFLPSIIFGAPDPAAALSVLPGHRLLLMGRGYEAVALTVLGGIGVAALVLLTLPILVYLIPFVYGAIRPVMHILLIMVVLWMVLTEHGWKRPAAFFIFLLAGIFGFVTLNAFPSGSLLFPSLTGLFAFSTLLTSLWTRCVLPEQDIRSELGGDHRKGILVGWLAGWLAGMLPGVGAAQAGAIAAQRLRAKTEEFLTALGGINTSNILFTLLMFYAIGKTRSGAVWAISQITGSLALWDMVILVLVGVTVSFMSGATTLVLGKAILHRIRGLDYRKITAAVMAFLIVMVYLLAGAPGHLAASTGMFIGLLSVLGRLRRSHLMGYLLFPTILYFSGLTSHMTVTLGI